METVTFCSDCGKRFYSREEEYSHECKGTAPCRVHAGLYAVCPPHRHPVAGGGVPRRGDPTKSHCQYAGLSDRPGWV